MTKTRMLRCWCFFILSSFVLPHSSFCDEVVARIGDIALTADEIETTEGLEEPALRKLVEAMLLQRVVLKEALEQKWDQRPETQKLLQNTREAAIADSYLKTLCEPPAGYPDENELQQAYEASKASLTVPRAYRLAQIFVSQDRLEAVQARLKAKPADFGLIAREMSEETQSAARDGEIGWVSETQIQPEILAQLPKLEINVISEPLRLKDGVHILKVLDVREAHTPFFAQVRAQLVKRLREEKARANLQAYMSKLLQQHPVAVDGVALSKLVQKTKP